MKERGVIAEIDGRTALVRFSMSEGCAHCNTSEQCKVNDRGVQAELPEGTFAVGDWVEVDVPAQAQASGILWLVVAPLVLFGAGYALVPLLVPGAGEGLAALGGIAGFALGLAGAALMSRRGAMARRPKVVSPAGAEPTEADPAGAMG